VTLRCWNFFRPDSPLLTSLVNSRSPVLCAPFFTSCEAIEFSETGHRREERPDLPVSLLLVLHALQLECEKSMELTASSHRSYFFFPSRDSRDEATLSESVPTGARMKERWRVLHSLSQHGTYVFRRPRGLHCLAADSRLLQKSWYALSIFNVCGGGKLSTDSPVRRQKRFQSALRKFQRFTESLRAGTLSLGGVIKEGRFCDRGIFPRTRLSGSRMSWPRLAKAMPGLLPTFHR